MQLNILVTLVTKKSYPRLGLNNNTVTLVFANLFTAVLRAHEPVYQGEIIHFGHFKP